MGAAVAPRIRDREPGGGRDAAHSRSRRAGAGGGRAIRD